MLIQITTITGELQSVDIQKAPGVYFVRSEHFGLVKVGCSRTLGHRAKQIQEGIPEPLYLIGGILTGDYRAAESWFHEKFKQYRKMFEWFNVNLEELRQASIEWRKISPASTILRCQPVILAAKDEHGLSSQTRQTIGKFGGLAGAAAIGRTNLLRNKGFGRSHLREVEAAVKAHELVWADSNSPEAHALWMKGRSL